MEISRPIKNFITLFSKIPGIGPRQATRIVFWLLHQPKDIQTEFSKTIENATTKIKLCADCFFPFEPKNNESLCEICRNQQREHSIICVVEKETDLLSIEKTNKYKGVYHILGGLMSEIDEKKKQELNIKPLLLRIKKSFQEKKPIKEIILALSPTSEGNLTTYYLEKAIKNLGLNIKITKLGRGLPHGGEVEFADSETLINALEGRK
ncbi:MAG: recombination protein RecR [Parcubacteria group bacterium]|nr:recombination protein RecR [Parcubacteria group bacterium]